jgi:hypothetical protein
MPDGQAITTECMPNRFVVGEQAQGLRLYPVSEAAVDSPY